ncbi:hypothetical protein BJY52DRAFT_1185334 [Lactarius psammicola]|nr:hypothetical protein BJY52DRAFT_1185334 [Lactarius psammicola]
MRKLFTRDKPKLAKVTPASRDIPPDLTSSNASESSIQPNHITRTSNHYKPSTSSVPLPPPETTHHPAPSSDDEHWHVLPSESNHNAEAAKLVPLTSSRSSSLASLPPGASPPLANPPVTTTRTASPFSGANSARSPHPKETREREKDRRGGAAAVSILNALNPQFAPPPPAPTNVDATRTLRDDDTVVYAPSEGSVREEKRERGGFWAWASSGGERDRDRREIHPREDGQQDLMRMIGYLTATSSEDWAVVLEVCERASATEANAKEAAKALRREFKYGEAPQQLSAARLWAIMLRNSSEIFVHQCMKSKFMDTLEDVLTSQRTSPVVRERLLDVLAAASYASSVTSSKNESSFRLLWRKVKPPGKPDEGVPFDPDDAMFNPPSPRRSSAFSPTPSYPPVHPQSLQSPTVPNVQHQTPPPPQPQPPQTQTPQQPTRPKREAPNQGLLQRVIPPEEDMRRLLQECRFAHGNAQLLSEALTYASPEDLREKDIIKAGTRSILGENDLIAAQIPWATAGADRSRAAREAQQLQQQRTIKRRNSPNGPGTPTIKPHRQKQGNGEDSPVELTPEEQLLGALLEANGALTSVLRDFDDIERIGIERETLERSRQEVRLDRSKNVVDDRGYVHHLDIMPTSLGSSSRSPSPSPSPSPKPPPIPIPAVLQPHAGQPHPLPPIPVQHQPNYAPTQPSLALPPPAPHGPRSPGLVLHRSHTPSPERGGLARPSLHAAVPNSAPPFSGEAPNGGALKPSLGIIVSRKENEDEDEGGEEEDIRTPIRPSAKALGKRRVVEAEEPDPDAFNPDDLFYERTEVRDVRNPGQDDSGMSDSDSDSLPRSWPQQPVHYAYDAVAERTQRLMQQMALVNGVH